MIPTASLFSVLRCFNLWAGYFFVIRFITITYAQKLGLFYQQASNGRNAQNSYK